MNFAARSRIELGLRKGLRAVAPAIVMGAVAFLLLRYPPERSGFYPRCPIFQLLHLRCPGCGATRALAALLRGHLLEAWHQNALFLLMLPLFLRYGAVLYARWVRGEALQGCQPSRAAVQAALVAAAAFMVIRNLPHVQF